MIRADTEKLREKYNSIFSTEKSKAEAFDKIAENYYLGNFGSMQKSDIDVLMFSIFIEGILDRSESNMDAYSDYTLAKQLGISQSRISTLKVKKQLQYPYDKFDWRRSFARVCENARYEGGKIKINVRDKNLYYELKNQLEEHGGYAEATLTSNLLVITPAEFIDLTEEIMSPDERDKLKAEVKKRYADDKNMCNQLEKMPLKDALREKSGNIAMDVLQEAVGLLVPKEAGFGLRALQAVCKIVGNAYREH